MKVALILIATAMVTGVPIVALACGACVEDMVAANYDHAIVDAAIAKHQPVVFVAVDPEVSVVPLSL